MKAKFILLFLTLFFFAKPFLWAQSSEWQDWRPTNCYGKIIFRIKFEKTKGNRFVWKLQFKNDYGRLVTFNYGISESKREYLTTHRITLASKEVGKPILVFTDKEEVAVLVDLLSFSTDGRKTLPCDGQ